MLYSVKLFLIIVILKMWLTTKDGQHNTFLFEILLKTISDTEVTVSVLYSFISNS